MVLGGYWSVYWYRGHIYGTEISRGIDVFALKAGDEMTEAEIAECSVDRVIDTSIAGLRKLIAADRAAGRIK
jgi:hypothetical protein